METLTLDGGWTSAIVAAVASLLGALGAGYIGARSALSREIVLKRRTAAERAADEIVDGLHAVRDVVKRSGFDQVRPADVSAALAMFQKAWDRQSHRLPQDWPHFSRELMAALGEYFGGVGWSHVYPGKANEPLAKFDPVWWENAEDYVRYLAYWTARWGDEPDRKPYTPLAFDPWLARRKARENGPPLPLALRLLQRVLG